MWIYLHMYLSMCVGFPTCHTRCKHSLKCCKVCWNGFRQKFSMGIRWAFARILCTAHADTHIHWHTSTHTRTNTKGMRLGLGLFWAWTRACPGLGFVSPLPPLPLRLLCQSWSFCFMTNSGEMCLQLLLLPASSTSLPLTWIWISRNLTSQLGWHRICVRVFMCVWEFRIWFCFLCNVRNLLLFIVRLGPLSAARII